MKIAIDCDDAAVDLKNTLVEHLRNAGTDIEDLNFAKGRDGVPYAEIGFHLAEQIRDGAYDRGILLCGTGLGMAIVANKVEGVYAGTCHDTFSAERLRKSNDAQVLTMGARVIGPELAKTIVDAWVVSEFAGGGSTSKVEAIRRLERQSFHPENK